MRRLPLRIPLRLTRGRPNGSVLCWFLFLQTYILLDFCFQNGNDNVLSASRNPTSSLAPKRSCRRPVLPLTGCVTFSRLTFHAKRLRRDSGRTIPECPAFTHEKHPRCPHCPQALILRVSAAMLQAQTVISLAEFQTKFLARSITTVLTFYCLVQTRLLARGECCRFSRKEVEHADNQCNEHNDFLRKPGGGILHHIPLSFVSVFRMGLLLVDPQSGTALLFLQCSSISSTGLKKWREIQRHQ